MFICLFVVCAPHANNTDRGIGLPRETDKTHDQLQVGAGSPVCQVTKFPSTKSTEAVSVGRSFLPRLTLWCPRPADALTPRHRHAHSFFHLLLKVTNYFQLIYTLAVQQFKSVHPRNQKKRRNICVVCVCGGKNLTQSNPDPETSPLPAANPPGQRLWLLINHSLGTFNV